MEFINYIPIVTTLFGIYFFAILYSHWKEKKSSKHVFWWMIGVLTYVAGTITESINVLGGFSVANFKAWYITGALLGGAPLAQGTVYLLCKRKTANILTVILITVIVCASILVVLSPVKTELITGKLSGKLLDWKFIRYITPFINLYAFILSHQVRKNPAIQKKIYWKFIDRDRWIASRDRRFIYQIWLC
jgi:hypothetical protein